MYPFAFCINYYRKKKKKYDPELRCSQENGGGFSDRRPHPCEYQYHLAKPPHICVVVLHKWPQSLTVATGAELSGRSARK